MIEWLTFRGDKSSELISSARISQSRHAKLAKSRVLSRARASSITRCTLYSSERIRILEALLRTSATLPLSGTVGSQQFHS